MKDNPAAPVKEVPDEESQFHEFFSKIPDAVIILGKTGVLLESNEMAEKVSGYIKDELTNRNVITELGFLDTKNKLLCIKKLAMVFAGSQIQPFEIEIKRKDGKTLPLEINAQLADYFNKSVAIVCLRDISERKKMEDEMKRLNQELETKIEELERINRMAIGRELKMVELKKRIAELEARKK